MTNKNEVYNLITEGYGAIAQNITVVLGKILEELGLTEIRGWQNLLNATGIAPEPIIVERILVRGAYNKPSRIQETLDSLVEQGYLTDDYVATSKAQDIIDNFIKRQRAELEKLNPLPEADMTRIIELFSKLTESIKQLTLPTPAFDDSQRRGIPDDMHLIEQYIRHGAYYFAFRDDAHLITWKPYNVSGHAWEILAYIWRGEAKSPADLPENIRNFRAFTEEEDQEAVQELLSRDWIKTTEVEGEYAITERGKRIRDKSEAGTDEVFYSVWNSLSDDEITELSTILTNFRDELQKTIPQPEGESA